MPSKEEVERAETLGKELARKANYRLNPTRTHSSSTSKIFKARKRKSQAKIRHLLGRIK